MTALTPAENAALAAVADDYLATYALAVEVFEDGGFTTPDEYRSRLAARLASDIRNAYVSDIRNAYVSDIRNAYVSDISAGVEADTFARRLYPVLLAGYDAISWERIAARLVEGFTLYGVVRSLVGAEYAPLSAPTFYLSLDEAATEIGRLVDLAGVSDEEAGAVAYALGEAVATNVVPVSVVAGGLAYRIATF